MTQHITPHPLPQISNAAFIPLSKAQGRIQAALGNYSGLFSFVPGMRERSGDTPLEPLAEELHIICVITGYVLAGGTTMYFKQIVKEYLSWFLSSWGLSLVCTSISDD